MLSWLKGNFEWIFSGVGVSSGVAIIGFLFKKYKPSREISSIVINSHGGTEFQIGGSSTLPNNEKKGEDLEQVASKKFAKILFVDDDIKFKVISILKTAGWKNTKIMKDIPDLDCFDVIDSNILFIDVQGVGKALAFSDEGLGLALALKTRYPKKKVIIYSAQTTGERFHQALRIVDYSLPKNSEPYEFIRLIEEYSTEIE